MPTATLVPNGATVNGGPFSNVTITGSAPQWGDGSDSTNATGDSTGGNLALMGAPLPPLVLPAGATVTGIRANVRASAVGGTVALIELWSGPVGISDFVCYFTNDTSDLSDNGTYGLNTSPANFDLVEATLAGVTGDPVAALEAGAYAGASTSGRETLTIYELTVFVDYTTGSTAIPVTFVPQPTVAPPLRQYPRSDGLGTSSARRHWPPPKSQQFSNRRAGGYL